MEWSGQTLWHEAEAEVDKVRTTVTTAASRVSAVGDGLETRSRGGTECGRGGGGVQEGGRTGCVVTRNSHYKHN